MTTTALNRWLKQLTPSIRGSRRGRRPKSAFRPGGEALEQRMVLSTLHWTGDGDNANWSNKSNWEEGKAPVAGDDLVFQASVHQLTNTNDLAANTAFKSITFEGAPYVISGNAIKFEATGTISVTATGASKLNVPISLSAGLTITTVDRANLNLGGAISGTGGLNKSGKGALALSGSSPNTFTQGLLVTQGMVQLSKTAGIVAVPQGVDIRSESGSTPIVRLLNSEQIDKNATVSVGDKCTLDLTDDTQTVSVLNVTGGKVEGTGQLVLLKNSTSGNGTIDAALSLGAGDHLFTISDGSTLTINGPISGDTSAQLVKSGGGALKLAGTTSNTYAGTTDVHSGTLLLSKSASKPENAIALSGPLVVGNTSKFPAEVRIDGTTAFKEAGLRITVNPSGLLDLNQHGVPVASLKMTGGTVKNGSLTLKGNVEATSGTRAGSASQPALINATVHLGAATRTFVVQDGPADVDLNITGQIDATPGVGLTKTGAGTLQFSGSASNTYTGTTSVLEGRLQLNKSGPDNRSMSGLLVIGADDVDAPAAIVQLLDSNEIKDDAPVIVLPAGLFDLNNKSDYIGALTLFSGQVKTGTGVLSLNRTLTAESDNSEKPSRITGNLNLGPAQGSYTREFKINQGLAPQDLIIDGVISGQKGAGLTKVGAGTVVFAGSTANTYEGATTVNEGLLELNKNNAKAIIGSLTIAGEANSQHSGRVLLLGQQQLAKSSNVSVLPLGKLDLNDKNQDIGNLNIRDGQVTAGDKGVLAVFGSLSMIGGQVTTGKDFVSGSLSLHGDVTAKASDAGPARLAGRIDLSHRTTTFTVGASGQTKPADLIIDAKFFRAAILEKAGSGVMVMGDDSRLPDLVNVRAGALRIAGTQEFTDFHVYGGVIEGSGTTKSIATGAQGKMQVRVGTSTTFGVLRATTGINLTPTATLEIKLNGAANSVPGVNMDQLVSAKGINLNGADLDLRGLNFTVPPKGTRFRIINNTGSEALVGTFAGLPKTGSLLTASLAGGKEAVFSIEYGVGTNKNDVDLVYKGLVD